MNFFNKLQGATLPEIQFQLRFHQRELYFPSTDEFKILSEKNCEKHPMYYDVDCNYTFHGKEYHSISYELYYGYNGAIGLGNCCWPEKAFLGWHDFDIERIKVLMDKKTYQPKFVYFSAHRSEGKWVPYDECEFTENKELIIYVARGSHANYPHGGTWWRIFGVANDKCSKRGKHIVPTLKHRSIRFSPENVEPDSPFKKRIVLLT